MSTSRTLVAPASPSQKKWYEDDPVVVEERQSQFSRAGVGFDAIQVKTQDLYEIGVLKLFIESEIMKSNSGAFELYGNGSADANRTCQADCPTLEFDGLFGNR